MVRPEWAVEMASLQTEYEAVKGKTFHSSWEDFLFCRLRKVEQCQLTLAEAIVDVGKSAGIIDGAQPLTGPQLLLVLGDVKHLVEEFYRAKEPTHAQ